MGDRLLYIANVLESRPNTACTGERPLLFSQVTSQSKYPKLRHLVRTTLVLTGVLDGLKRVQQKLRPVPAANIAATTYRMAGATEEELEVLLKSGAVDRSRVLNPPSTPVLITKTVGVCVVGTGWGQTHARYLRMLGSNVR